MKLGITGHQHLPEKGTWAWVERELNQIIREDAKEELVGLSSLAIGADQLFARLILAAGGELHIIIPFAGYERTFETPEDLASYKELISKASDIEVLTPQANDEESFFAAGKRIATKCDVLIAVWDGQKAKGLGGTADVVYFARNADKPVIHLDTNKCIVTGARS